MSNPPYSIGQKSANDNAQNQEYSKLNKRIIAITLLVADFPNICPFNPCAMRCRMFNG